MGCDIVQAKPLTLPTAIKTTAAFQGLLEKVVIRRMFILVYDDLELVLRFVGGIGVVPALCAHD